MHFAGIEKFITEKTDFPLKDRYDLPSSGKVFPGGAHYRMEVPGIECASNFESMLAEADRRSMPVHRVIGTVGGSALLDFQELKHYAQIGAQSKTEVLLNPIPARSWDSGRQYVTPEGYVSGMRLRGHDSLYHWLKEFDRCLEAGIRGFLIPDEGLLYLLGKMRADGAIPKNVKFKVSVFAGHGNGVGGRLLEELGADSFNPLADLTLPMLAAIRSVVDLPLDVYMSIVDSMGGHQRQVEAAEIARICSPVYFKFEPGKSEAELYNAWKQPEYQDFLVREKVKYAQICKEWCDKSDYGLVFNNDRGDLSVPEA
jgi:hypothetical protein